MPIAYILNLLTYSSEDDKRYLITFGKKYGKCGFSHCFSIVSKSNGPTFFVRNGGILPWEMLVIALCSQAVNMETEKLKSVRSGHLPIGLARL
jgi:hypothetical protein